MITFEEKKAEEEKKRKERVEKFQKLRGGNQADTRVKSPTDRLNEMIKKRKAEVAEIKHKKSFF